VPSGFRTADSVQLTQTTGASPMSRRNCRIREGASPAADAREHVREDPRVLRQEQRSQGVPKARGLRSAQQIAEPVARPGKQPGLRHLKHAHFRLLERRGHQRFL
jgi:hypothetical protein